MQITAIKQLHKKKRLALSLPKGFTLIELLIVITIIGILASIIIPRILGSKGKAKEDQAVSTLREVSLSLERYKLDCGRYPSSLSGTDTSGGKCTNSLGTFLPSSVNNPNVIAKYVPLTSSPDGTQDICDGYHIAVNVTALSKVTLEQDDDFNSAASSPIWKPCNVPSNSGFNGIDNPDPSGNMYFDIVMPHYFKGN